jgi:hypothetical protein
MADNNILQYLLDSAQSSNQAVQQGLQNGSTTQTAPIDQQARGQQVNEIMNSTNRGIWGKLADLLSTSGNPQTQQPKSTEQHVIEQGIANGGVKSIEKGPDGNTKITFGDRTQAVSDRVNAGNPPISSPTQETPASNTTPQFSMEDLSTLINDAVAKAVPQNQPQVNRTDNPNILGPGSDTVQPGDLYKVLTLLAGGGGYKPSSETAYNAAVMQKLLGQEKIQPKEKAEMTATAYSTQVDLANKDLERLKSADEAADKMYEQRLKSIRASGRYGGAGKLNKQYEAEKNRIAGARQTASDRLTSLFGKNPNLPSAASDTPNVVGTYKSEKEAMSAKHNSGEYIMVNGRLARIK